MRFNIPVSLRRLAVASWMLGILAFSVDPGLAVDRLVGLHSAQVMSQSMPWIAQEAGLFKKYDLDFRLVFIPSSPVATAATLNGDAEIGVTGAPAAGALLHPAADALLRHALPLLGELAPAQVRELQRTLRNLTILQRERVGCFMPAVPQVR